MSHSKGLFSGTCPGNYRNYGRPREDGDHHMVQQQKCGRCGKVRNKRVRKCLFRHPYQTVGKPDHGYVKQKCTRCGWRETRRITGCGFFRACSWHNCGKIPGLHCARCASGRG